MFVSQYVCLIAFTLLYLGSYLDTECYGFHILDHTNSNYISRIKRQSCGFRCANDECIDRNLLCNGMKDCPDGSDETLASCNTNPCQKYQYRCAYGACVDGDSKCNGILDCADGSDESALICGGTPVTPPVTPPTLPDGSCALPPQPANGKYISDQSQMNLTYSCSSGYQLYPSPNKNIVICKSGKWYPSLPECLQTCGPRVSDSVDTYCELQGIKVDCSKPMVEGTTVRMSCTHLYSQVDSSANPVGICRDGSWDYGLIKCVPDCGNIVPEGGTFVIGGEHAKKSAFPWHVGIYKLNDSNQYEQKCGGSIISRKLILSAARCFTEDADGAPYDAKLYAVAAGKYYRDYYEGKDTLSQNSTVKKIIIPERYKGLRSSFEADIAFVILDKALEITHVVQPVCIDWNNEYERTQLRDNNEGTVVGWGYTNDGQDSSVALKQLSVPFINLAKCYRAVPKNFTRFLTADKFCAGFTNGSNVCHGDSGGGLVFKKEDTKKYYLRGLVSVGPVKEGACDSRQYGAYTKVSEYMEILRSVEISTRGFRCANDECIDRYLLCNGMKDCLDGSDETLASCNTIPCQKYQYRCAYGACVDGDSKCNGILDCADGSDESPQICGGTPVTPPVTPSTLPDGSCALPPQPANGKYTTDQSLTRLRYSCSSGYQIYPNPNQNIAHCEPNGWYPGIPECLQTCGPRVLDSVETYCEYKGIKVDCSKPMVEGTTVQMSCTHLYSQVDSSAYPVSTCRNGSWDYGLIKCVPDCGNIVPEGGTFPTGGDYAKKSMFPWHVGIYKLNDSNQYEQKCSGSIISRNLILSAAHCFTNYANGAPYDVKLYAVAAGKYYRDYYEEKDTLSQNSTIKKIIIPERYKGVKTSFEADIAFVILNKALEITHLVQPVCIDWNNQYERTQLRDNNEGTVVGWEYTNEGQDSSVELKHLSVPFINFAKCYGAVPDSFTRFLTNDKFCAGFTNGSSVCHGDSGGGLVFKKEDTKKYYLRGVVSVGPLAEGKCDSRQYGAYIKVSVYMETLRSVETSTRG